MGFADLDWVVVAAAAAGGFRSPEVPVATVDV